MGGPMKRAPALGDEGTSFVEYILIVGVVALVCIGAFGAFGTSVTGKLARQGESVVAMEGRVRSLDAPNPATAKGASGPEPATEGRTGGGWAAAIEDRKPVTAAVAENTDDGSAFQGVLLFLSFLIAGAAVLAFWWRRGELAGEGRAPLTAKIASLLVPATRYISALRSHVAGRLPWTPRE
jgi:Flp pilus assembly pilin Flp